MHMKSIKCTTSFIFLVAFRVWYPFVIVLVFNRTFSFKSHKHLEMFNIFILINMKGLQKGSLCNQFAEITLPDKQKYLTLKPGHKKGNHIYALFLMLGKVLYSLTTATHTLYYVCRHWVGFKGECQLRCQCEWHWIGYTFKRRSVSTLVHIIRTQCYHWLNV